jgi:carbonic anhydrase
MQESPAAMTTGNPLPGLPRRGLVVLTCMDHRIDPAAALGLELGDAMVIRNAGGRVTPSFLRDLQILDRVAAKRGSDLSQLELVLMQHTDCGAGGLAGEHDDLLASQLGIPVDELASRSPADPRQGVIADIAVLAADQSVPAALSVAGIVYDVETGRAELVERRSRLR